MIIYANDPQFHYELEAITRMFLPERRVIFSQTPPEAETEAVLVRVNHEGGESRFQVDLCLDGRRQRLEGSAPAGPRETELGICRLLYRLLSCATGRSIQWGILTGIRPVKLVRKMREEGRSPEEIQERLTRDYLVSPEKAALCLKTDQIQAPVVASALPNGYSLYISIPFCPSRCSYCSFVSHSIEKTWKLIPEYLQKLEEELLCTAGIAREKGLVLQSIYVGGGTPTVLTAQQLDGLLGTVTESFDLSCCQEFTVEAGRPDTIDREKLSVLRRHGVDRVSINTQSLNDHILEVVGRKHTVEDFLRSYNDAKEFDFTAVNVDLIAGLTGETLDSFQDSLDRVAALEPENITVHSLTVKRAAGLQEEKSLHLNAFSPVADMVNYSQKKLAEGGWLPYYMYRQKSTVDSLENVGFARPGTLCQYNIFIMDETHTILSAGGGGVTKLVLPGDRGIHRIFNYKYPYEYIGRFDQILERKREILNFPL